MKIAIFTDTFYPTLNGIVTSTDTFIKELSDRWHEILVVTVHNKWIEKYSYPNVTVYPIKWIPAFFYPEFKITFNFFPKLLRKIKDFWPDVIHYQTQFIIGWQAMVIWKLLKIPRIGSFHTYIADEKYLEHLGFSKFKIMWKVGWKYNNHFYNHCEHVICPTEFAKKDLIENGVRKKNITVVSNPIKTVNHEKIKSVFKRSYWENAIIYVWRLSREKSLDVLFEALYVVTKEIPDVKLLVVGWWPDQKELHNYVKELWLQKNVVFLWKIPHDDLIHSDLFINSKLFVTASETETQWLTILEAMQFGLPIVWVEAKWVWEIIRDNWLKAKSWNYWEIALYIIRLLKNETLRKELWSKSMNYSQEYNKVILTDKLEKLYISLVK